MSGVLKILTITTTHGPFTAHFTERGMSLLLFPGQEPPPGSLKDRPGKQTDGQESDLINSWIDLCRSALLSAMEGRQPEKLPPLDLTAGSTFQQEVWKALMRIPRGQVSTYSRLAIALSRPKAARAVGQACGKNPVPVLIPCHRVLAADGTLGGFSGGLDWKLRLLSFEGVRKIEFIWPRSEQAPALVWKQVGPGSHHPAAWP
jgi:methylated-DNA-[protein]-cysteine S-methyltransferase